MTFAISACYEFGLDKNITSSALSSRVVTFSVIYSESQHVENRGHITRNSYFKIYLSSLYSVSVPSWMCSNWFLNELLLYL